MKATMFLAALAIVAVLTGPAAAQDSSFVQGIATTGPVGVSTRGMRYRGYTYTTDISDLLLLDYDACSIFEAVAAGDVARALDIFYNGSATPVSFAELTASNTNRFGPLWTLMFNDAVFSSTDEMVTFLENAIVSANTLRRPVSVLQALLLTAKAKIFIDFMGNTLSNIISNNMTQANLDAAFAVFSGRPGPECPNNVFDVYNIFSNVWGTQYRGIANPNLYMAQVFGDLQAFSAYDRNRTAATRAIIGASRLAAAVYIDGVQQLTMFNAISIDLGRACNNSEIVEAARFQHTLFVPVVKALARGLGATLESIGRLENVTASGGSYMETLAALDAMLKTYGGDVKNVGGRPDIDAVKDIWYRNSNLDTRNCTAVVLP